MYPFANAFFMFRAGLYDLTLEYLNSYSNEGVRLFGKCFETYYK